VKVFLDLDGPILDNSGRYYSLYRQLLSQAGHTPLGQAEYWEAKRRRVAEEDIIRRTCPEEFIPSYLTRRLEIIEDYDYLLLDRVWENAPAILGAWSREHALYLVTLRKHRAVLIKQLEHLHLLPYFRSVYSEDHNDGTWAVKQRLIEHEIDDPAHCVIIGDTDADILAGKALGIRTVAVTCGIRTKELLLSYRPDHLVPNLGAVVLANLV
jgi:phosphoglycolate phosphatase-like HAD superfamily hydrolase